MPFARFFFAASDGAAETAIAMTATVPTSRVLAMDMIPLPPLEKTRKNYTPDRPSQDQSGPLATAE
jgi:hypothetical protein